jgi:N-acyl-L-homoserine lactone synthetase
LSEKFRRFVILVSIRSGWIHLSTLSEFAGPLQIVQGLVDVAAENGASSLMSLSPLALMRALRQLGFDDTRIGEPYLNEGDGRRYAALSMPAKRTMPHMPRATHRTQPMPLHAPSVV